MCHLWKRIKSLSHNPCMWKPSNFPLKNKEKFSFPLSSTCSYFWMSIRFMGRISFCIRIIGCFYLSTSSWLANFALKNKTEKESKPFTPFCISASLYLMFVGYFVFQDNRVSKCKPVVQYLSAKHEEKNRRRSPKAIFYS